MFTKQAIVDYVLMGRLIFVPENFQGWKKPLKAGIWSVTSLMANFRRLFALTRLDAPGQ